MKTSEFKRYLHPFDSELSASLKVSGHTLREVGGTRTFPSSPSGCTLSDLPRDQGQGDGHRTTGPRSVSGTTQRTPPDPVLGSGKIGPM